MENTNKNNSNNNVEFGYTNLLGQTFTHDMVVDHIDQLAGLIKNHMWVSDGVLNDVVVKEYFAEFGELKAEFTDDAVKRSLTKFWWSHFNNHEQAVIKNACKTATNVVSATQDKFAAMTNVLILPVGEQMRKMGNILSATLKKGQFALFYSRREYTEAFKTMTVEEYSTLYRGRPVKVEDLIAYLGRKIKTERKAQGAK